MLTYKTSIFTSVFHLRFYHHRIPQAVQALSTSYYISYSPHHSAHYLLFLRLGHVSKLRVIADDRYFVCFLIELTLAYA